MVNILIYAILYTYTCVKVAYMFIWNYNCIYIYIYMYYSNIHIYASVWVEGGRENEGEREEVQWDPTVYLSILVRIKF